MATKFIKRGDSVETKSGLKGKILYVDFKDQKPESVVIEAAEDGERYRVLVANLKDALTK